MTSYTPLWQRITATCALALAAPPLAVAGVAIRVSSSGPVLYRARRVGVGGRPFTMYKLRTMHVGSDARGSITSANDPRIFPAGRWIRRLKLDELPQLLNVIAGDMALVGPRPEAADVVAASYQQWMMETLAVPPGVTGPGSVRFIEQERELPADVDIAARVYAAELLPRKLAHELVYVRNPSLSYELQLMARTVLGVLGGARVLRRALLEESRKADLILAEVTQGEVL